jgi:hypothetical protein
MQDQPSKGVVPRNVPLLLKRTLTQRLADWRSTWPQYSAAEKTRTIVEGHDVVSKKRREVRPRASRAKATRSTTKQAARSHDKAVAGRAKQKTYQRA